MIRVFCTCIFLLAFASNIYSQGNYEDVVYLKNGSVIHGLIIEQVPNESLKIQTRDKNIFVFKMDEILKITKEQPVVQPPVSAAPVIKEPPKPKTKKVSGYTNITELTFSRSFSQTHSYNGYYGYGYRYDSHFDNINNGPSFGIQTVNGYQFNPYLSMGVGIGMKAYSELFLVPLFLDFHATFINAKVSPFIAAEIGNSFTRHQIFGINTSYEDEGGFMGSVVAGVKFFPINQMALNFGIGYNYQELRVQNDDMIYSYSPVYSDKSLNQFTVRAGFTF